MRKCYWSMVVAGMLLARVNAGDDLAATRDKLVAELEQKPVAENLLLRLDEGADRDTMQLTLRRAGGQWTTAFAEVPGWQQSTMQEWRGYYLGNEMGGCWRPNMRFSADTTGLKLDSNQLTGALTIAYKLDQTMLERQPPGQRIQWWDKFIPGGYSLPRQQRYRINAEVRSDGGLLDLVLENGVYWDAKWVADAKKAPPANSVTRRPIYVRLQVPSTRFTLAKAGTPTWNNGFHEADATGLRFANGRLTGTLVVFLHQDGWGPWGSGKHTQHEALPITFQVDAQLKNNELIGRYTASVGGEIKGLHYAPGADGHMTVIIPNVRFDGAISGRGGKLVVGRFQSQGDLGDQIGAVDGMVLDQPAPLRQQLAASQDVFHQVRALHLALQHYPLPYDEAYRQTDMPDVVERASRPFADESLNGRDARSTPKPETTGDSPSLGAAALPVEEKVNVLPADATGWSFLAQWNVLGPFDQRLGLENDIGLVPDLVVLPDAAYSQPVDRLGATRADAPAVKWQTVTCTTPRLGVPWEGSGIFVRFGGRLWYGAATLRSAQARTVWLSLEANDFAKLWINNQLVWVDAEKTWRYRPNGRVFVPVALQAGENQLLTRVHNDRRLSWLRLALTTKEPVTSPAPPATYANPNIFSDAQPPLAWDIAKGINVAWRNAALGGETRPVVVGDALVVSSNTGALKCLDLATGKERWSVQVGEGEASEPVTDGKLVWCFASAVGCYDLSGKPIWSQPTGLTLARLYRHGSRLVVEGSGKRDTIAVIILDAATGKEQKKWELPGRFDKKGQLLSVGAVGVLLTSTGAWLDIVNGTEMKPLDIEMQLAGKEGVVTDVTAGPYVLSRSADMFFLTSQARHQAARLWAKDGQLAYAHAWESNYGNSGFGNAAAPALATDKFLFTTHASLAHTPHAPDPRSEINVQDAKTGRVLGHLKPALEDLYAYSGNLNLKTPTMAGEYLFLLGGRADNTRTQMAVVTADEQLQLLARNDVDPGTAATPVFAGGRMFLRSPTALTCIAATTPDGRQYQNQVLARMLLKVVGPQPQSARQRVITGLEKVSTMGNVPVGKLNPERTTEFWLGAGPLSAAEMSALKLPAIDGVKFAPLDRDHAYNEPPMYIRQYELQGTGDIVPFFKSALDPRGQAGPLGSGLFYTVLDNTRDRVVVPVLKASGVTQWLGGQELKPDEPLYLRAGLYPYLVRVDPEYFQIEARTELATVTVSNALAAGVIREVNWPAAWQVLGPLPPDAPPLTPDQLRDIPQRLTMGEVEYPTFEFPVQNRSVNLNMLAETASGQKPDLARTPATLGSSLPGVAYLFGTVDCPAEGYLYIGAGADWYMRWFVDGAPLHPEIKEGMTGNVNAHRLTARVTKGRHIIAVMLRPGTQGWKLSSIAGFSEKSPEQMPEFRVAPPAPLPLDLRLNPSFREIPHPPTLAQMWRERATRNRERLAAVSRDLPGSAEASAAANILAAVGQ